MAFRHREPFQALGTTALTDPAWWRDRLQGHALAAGDVSPFYAQVDFGRLEDGRDTELRGRPEGVPRSGRMNRILASHFETRQGTDFSVSCGATSAGGCTGQLLGRLQPYTLYVPPRRPAGGRYQLTLLLHSLTANYNQFSDSRNQTQFANRRRPSLVITPEGRGPDGFYNSTGGADTFEVWADVARHYRLDPARTSIAGYSMGGFGTFKLADTVPRPVCPRPAHGGRAGHRRRDAGLGAMGAVPDVERRGGRARAARSSSGGPRTSSSGSATATSCTCTPRPRCRFRRPPPTT